MSSDDTTKPAQNFAPQIYWDTNNIPALIHSRELTTEASSDPSNESWGFRSLSFA